MVKYLMKFDEHEEYVDTKVSGLVKPNVSVCVEERHTHYKKKRKPKVLKFVAEQAGSTVRLNRVDTAYYTPAAATIQFSTDDGVTWNDYQFTLIGSHDDSRGASGAVVTLPNVGDSVMFRGENESLGFSVPAPIANHYHNFVMNGRIAAYGDLSSLFNGVGGEYTLNTDGKNCQCMSLFENCKSLTRAPEVTMTSADDRCYWSYRSMFAGCSNLSWISAMFKNAPHTGATMNWVSGVSQTGTFVMNEDAEWDPEEYRGVNGVPQGWTVVMEEM